MATLLSGQGAISRNPVKLSKGSSTVSINSNDFFFHCDNPEGIKMTFIADNGKYLHMASVSGTGMVYTWHDNQAGQTLTTCILIHNPNSFAIKVSVPNYGLTTASSVITDAAAWGAYMSGQSTSITINPNAYGNLFSRSVYNGGVCGVIARMQITNSSTGAIAGATLYDLAYKTNSGGGTAFADLDGTTRKRGLGAGYYTILTFDTITPPLDSNGVYFTIGSEDDTFSGTDCSYITDSGGCASGRLAGAYGQQYVVTLPIKNTTGTARSFKIFIGSRGGYSFPFASIGGQSIYHTQSANAFTYRDIIDTGVIANGATMNVSFTTAVPAVSSTAYAIGVHAL